VNISALGRNVKRFCHFEPPPCGVARKGDRYLFFADITLTFIDSRHPRELLHYLTKVRGYTVEETSPGIYGVTGDYLPIQIIESKKLPDSENFWLNALRKDLEARHLSAILEERKKRGSGASLDAYIDVILRSNPKIFKEVYEMEFEAYDKLFKDAGIEPKWVVQGREEGKEIAARNLLDMGMPIEDIARASELPIEKVRSLAAAG